MAHQRYDCDHCRTTVLLTPGRADELGWDDWLEDEEGWPITLCPDCADRHKHGYWV